MKLPLDMTKDALKATIFLLLLTLFLFGVNIVFTSREVHDLQVAEFNAGKAAASVVQLCRDGNAHDRKQIVLWEKIIAISKPPPHETLEQRRNRLTETAAVLSYIHRLFAPANCSNLSVPVSVRNGR